jgi:hypothetical protein
MSLSTFEECSDALDQVLRSEQSRVRGVRVHPDVDLIDQVIAVVLPDDD